MAAAKAAKPKAKPAAKKAAKKPAAKKAAPKKQEQCAALTAGGTRCKRPSTTKSKYCASHKGYTPAKRKAAQKAGAAKARAVKGVRARAKKSKGGTGPIRNRPAAVKVMGSKKLCAAKTASGSPCKNAPRPGSKYCARHKGGR
jgi:hypothetical protein